MPLQTNICLSRQIIGFELVYPNLLFKFSTITIGTATSKVRSSTVMVLPDITQSYGDYRYGNYVGNARRR